MNLIGTFYATDVARVEFAMLPQQSLMELVVQGFVSKDRLCNKNDDGYSDIETWDGVQFNYAEEVNIVEWRDYLHTHFPDGGTLEIQWLPSTVRYFALTGSTIEGTIEVSLLPRGMERLYLQRNRITGTLVLPKMPETMEYFIMHTNQLSGSLDLMKLPAVLKALHLYTNQFSGTVVIGDSTNGVEIKLGNNLFDEIVDENGETSRDRLG
ncbi:leucine-rich repeat protein [Perkinsela sp. CCAP 1560/4]|nr:leucine-rich repeat protein [Perkinsela sp. CCAP 1560/4]|eukprot:KNH04332.1 leucine-rich repeat protein [Perkinsela sp. CCAP 1560/4]